MSEADITLRLKVANCWTESIPAAMLAALDAVDPLRAEGTVCVRLDGLADKIARAIGCSAEYDGAAVVALLQSLAVQ